MRNFALTKEDITWSIDDTKGKEHITGTYHGETFDGPFHVFSRDEEDKPLLTDIEAMKENLLLKFNKHHRVHHQQG